MCVKLVILGVTSMIALGSADHENISIIPMIDNISTVYPCYAEGQTFSMIGARIIKNQFQI